MAKEACEAFVVRAKQLLKLLLGKVYLSSSSMKRLAPKEGPKLWLKKKKSVWAQLAIKDDNNDKGEDDNGTRWKVRD